ncbi:MAG: SH3 domain-containing protein [Deltaproteobacteria bacterium]|nr:SH3 domain-containing protein [Deltaproteobacteria bacterium]
MNEAYQSGHANAICPERLDRTRVRGRCNLLRPVLAVLLFVLTWTGAAGGAVIRDLTDLSQDPLSYVDRNAADVPLIPAPEQARLNAEFDLQYFAPWHRTEPHHTPELASWGFRKFDGNPGYGKGGRPHSPDWIRKMAANAHLDDYPQGIFPAVTVKRTDFRHFPTREPHSSYPTDPEMGDPFDNLQASSAPAGMPVLVTLVSRDRKWFLTETNHLLGWVPAEDIAAVDPSFMRTWENGRYVTVVRDKTPVRDGKTVLCRAPLGAVFPRAGEDKGRIWIWTAARDARGKAILRKTAVAKEAAADKPLPFTPRHVACLAREMAGEPYGWGGLGGKRDCSALIRDLFTPFGLWLPRNSSEQAVAGRFISLSGLSPAGKEALIIRTGAPWRTLLWTPGHIMLYIGTHRGKPLIFHNFWSIRTRDADGKKGRVIVGRASVTTLHPGSELRNPALPRSDRLNGLEGMVFLGEPPSGNGTNLGTKP